MKKLLNLLLALSICVAAVAQERPDWVKQRPVNTLSFTGIGMAKKSDKDYMQKAKQNALSELVSEIKVEVSVNSLLNTMDDGTTIKQAFAESIRTKAKEEIERFRLVDSWQNSDEYWVYYELNRFDYEEYMEARRQKAIKAGFDFWYNGQVALQQGELPTAIDLFSKGLEAIQPAINQDLTCAYNGGNMNLGSALYTSLTGVFNGTAIATNPMTVNGTAFKGIFDPIAVGIYKNGTPLKNMRLKAEFVSGAGDLSTMAPTDETGVSALYIQNITSKQAQQQVRISVDTSAFNNFRSGINAAIFKKILAILPEATLTIYLEQTQINAYLEMGQNDIESLERNVKSILTNNYFNVVSSPAEADVIVKMDNSFKPGVKVPGELYDFVECFGSVGIQVVNNRTAATLMNYSANDVRVLVPGEKSVIQGKSMVGRELMKRLQRELNKELKKVTIDTSSKVPVPVEAPTATPIPELPAGEAAPPAIEEPDPTPAPIRAELETNVFIEFVKLTSIRNVSKLHFKIINETDDDFKLELYLWNNKVFVVNEKGEQFNVLNAKVGSMSSDHRIEAIIVPDLPTEMIVDVNKLESVALFSLTDASSRTIKMRNLQ